MKTPKKFDRMFLNNSYNFLRKRPYKHNSLKKLEYMRLYKQYRYYAKTTSKVLYNQKKQFSTYTQLSYDKISLQKRGLARLPFWISYDSLGRVDSDLKNSHSKLIRDQHIWYYKSINDKNIYKAGISDKFIKEYGHIDFYRIDVETDKIIYKGYVIGCIEIDKATFPIINPFENAMIKIVRNDLEDIINSNPMYINNWIFQIEEIKDLNPYDLIINGNNFNTTHNHNYNRHSSEYILPNFSKYYVI